MKLKGQKSKLKVYIPDDIDCAIGANARHLVNECGRVVRTKAPLNVKTWKESFTKAGDSMWREIENKFDIKEGSSYIKMQAFCIETMQHLYRLWKSRLHSYYKSCGRDDKERLEKPHPDLPKEQWQYCVERFGDPAFKRKSEQNSKNRLSKNRTTQTTGNLSFAEVGHILTEENNGVTPSADVIWLIEHTKENDQGEFVWADESRSKEIHEQLKDVVTHGDTMSQEEILLQVLKPRSGYFRDKGTALPGFSKGRRQLVERQNLINDQQKTIREQQELIKELQQYQERTTKQLEESQQVMARQLQQLKEETQRAMDAMKEELLRQLAGRVTS